MIIKNEPFNDFYKFLKSKSLIEVTEEEYRKLFWYIYEGQQVTDEKNHYEKFNFPFFIDLSQIFFDDFISLIIESIQKSLVKSNNQEIANLEVMCRVFFPFPYETLNKGFDKKSVDRLINYFITLDFDIYQELNDINRNQYILELLLLDKLKHYEFIKKLLEYDTKNSQSYLTTLYGMRFHGKSEKEIIEDFFDIYDRLVKEQKMDFYKSLTDLPEWNNEGNFFENIELKSLEMLLVDYYELFDSNTFYKDMNNDLVPKQPLTFVNNLWIYLSKKEYKSFLEDKLIVHENRKLSTRAKIVLDRLYNSLGREKKDYKKIFDNYKNKKDRFFDYQQLKKDLIEISLLETEHRKTIYKESEDETNDRFRKDLHLKGYVVADQSRGGESQSTRSVGERDLVIRDKESGVAESIIEAFQLDSSDDTNKIKTHYKKLVEKYDTVGNSDNFILVYIKTNNFDYLWEKYKDKEFFFNFIEENSEKENLKIGSTQEKNMIIHHLFINFYSYSRDSNE